MFFYIFLGIIIFQRISELIVSKQNEKWMKSRGAIEFGQKHYPYIVIIHTMFFVSYLVEVLALNKQISKYWILLLVMFLLTQVVRIWALTSLGRYWNTKIIVLPNAKSVVRGPYRFLKHPNYAIVILEFLIIPLFYHAFITMLVFSILNLWILSIRIPEEERALQKLAMYPQ